MDVQVDAQTRLKGSSATEQFFAPCATCFWFRIVAIMGVPRTELSQQQLQLPTQMPIVSAK